MFGVKGIGRVLFAMNFYLPILSAVETCVPYSWLCGVQWLGRSSRDERVAGSTAGRPTAGQRPWTSASHTCAQRFRSDDRTMLQKYD